MLELVHGLMPQPVGNLQISVEKKGDIVVDHADEASIAYILWRPFMLP